MIPIHEFSTGIKAERTPNGGWVSLGFLGKYINCTLEPIPYPVERSIANQEFALTEGASTDQPAIIGRVVGTGEDSWAVIAVVTRARDEKRRSLSVYRYFLTPGANNLRYVLAWWESQGRPTFNPFDGKYIGTYAYFDPASAPSSDYDPTANYIELVPTKPTLLEPYQYNLTTIHTLAIKKHNLDPTQPISWAFNVEAVEKPHSFQVIQPSSPRAYETLEREISKPPRSLPAVFIDEAALKSAIRALINNSQVKADAVQVIVKELNNKQITPQYWEALFDGQGASTAITQRNYSPPLVRLITLRAIVIPETLPEFLKWLNVQSGKQPSEAESISLQFQGAICEYFPKEKLGAGIKLLIPYLLKEEISPESIQWLFIKGRAWAVCYSQFIKDVHYDLEVIHQQSKVYTNTKDFDSLKFPLDIWQELISSWNGIISGYYKLTDYEPLAELFELLEKYDLSAYFYQVSNGEVPKDVFLAASPNPSNEPYSLKYLGLTLQRQITLSEQIMKFTKLGLTIAAGVGFLGLVFFAGYFVGGGFSSDNIKNVKILESENKDSNNNKEQVIEEIVNSTKHTETEVKAKLKTVLKNVQPQEYESLKNVESFIEDIKLSQKISAYHTEDSGESEKLGFSEWLSNLLSGSNTSDTNRYQNLVKDVSSKLREDAIKEAIKSDNFDITMGSLDDIFGSSEVSASQQPMPNTVNTPTDKQKSQKIISLYKKIKSNPENEETKKLLVGAIYDYQLSTEDKGVKPDGIIREGKETYKKLKQDIGT
ncbi:hypothetical protein [Anabaena sp. CS-542/02]|uniref:hypothetical protein n=1 Tax=Anabaena sp. CS-542/02 TaxID=3021719 RepID=UPI00232F2D90|nr:hypothetical protein [Anabaena sp. CS-542/02]MDB9445467.1 hypothetical protein [Anabaena sp. CS-542/02]